MIHLASAIRAPIPNGGVRVEPRDLWRPEKIEIVCSIRGGSALGTVPERIIYFKVSTLYSLFVSYRTSDVLASQLL